MKLLNTTFIQITPAFLVGVLLGFGISPSLNTISWVLLAAILIFIIVFFRAQKLFF